MNPTSQNYLDATARVGQFTDQSISLFDAVRATVASRIGAPVWTFDYHFDVMKSDVWR